MCIRTALSGAFGGLLAYVRLTALFNSLLDDLHEVLNRDSMRSALLARRLMLDGGEL